MKESPSGLGVTRLGLNSPALARVLGKSLALTCSRLIGLSALLLGVNAIVGCAVEAHKLEQPDPIASGSAPSVSAEPSATMPDAGGHVFAECSDKKDCDDENVCNGVERCLVGRCVSGKLADDGADCSDGMICVMGSCVASRCGDGITSGEEACDDQNKDDSDGCTKECAFTCSGETDCPAAAPCHEATLCDEAKHLCIFGTALPELSDCGTDQVCSSGQCVARGCGNGTTEAKEECDDGNQVLGDGCQPNCTFSCKLDTDCDNQNACDGKEVCDPQMHVCVAGAVPNCDDGKVCTTDGCDPKLGCTTAPIDMDGDGHSPVANGCGDDCNDSDPSVHKTATELCDGKDNNCNGASDETAPTWYVDCDGDGYAALGAVSVQDCNTKDSPLAPPTGCASGLAATWTSRAPVTAGETDCWDRDPLVHPRTSADNDAAWSTTKISGRSSSEEYDYNCALGNEPQETATSISTTASCKQLQLVVTPIKTLPASIDWFASPTVLGASPELGIAPIPILFVPCVGSAGWTGASVPGCAVTADYSQCSGATGSCVRSVVSLRQACR